GPVGAAAHVVGLRRGFDRGRDELAGPVGLGDRFQLGLHRRLRLRAAAYEQHGERKDAERERHGRSRRGYVATVYDLPAAAFPTQDEPFPEMWTGPQSAEIARF